MEKTYSIHQLRECGEWPEANETIREFNQRKLREAREARGENHRFAAGMALVAFLMALGAASSAFAAGSCAALDYQEMKDMSKAELTEKYCQYSGEAKQYMENEARFSTYSSSLRTINESVFDMQRSRDAGIADDRADRSLESAKQCKSQMDRIARVMALAGAEK